VEEGKDAQFAFLNALSETNEEVRGRKVLFLHGRGTRESAGLVR